MRAQERVSRGAAGHHLHDKMLLRSVDLMMSPGYYPLSHQMLDVRTSGNCVCVMDCAACPVSGKTCHDVRCHDDMFRPEKECPELPDPDNGQVHISGRHFQVSLDAILMTI